MIDSFAYYLDYGVKSLAIIVSTSKMEASFKGLYAKVVQATISLSLNLLHLYHLCEQLHLYYFCLQLLIYEDMSLYKV